MHMTIAIIVFAGDSVTASAEANTVIDGLTGEDKSFDYGTSFVEIQWEGMAGIARWGLYPPVVKADSENGKKLIYRRMGYMKEGFKENITQLRERLRIYSDEALFETEDFDKDIRYICNCLGEYRGPEIWLYDGELEGIRNTHDLKNRLNKWKVLYEDKKQSNPHKYDDVWVIPYDVHH